MSWPSVDWCTFALVFGFVGGTLFLYLGSRFLCFSVGEQASLACVLGSNGQYRSLVLFIFFNES